MEKSNAVQLGKIDRWLDLLPMERRMDSVLASARSVDTFQSLSSSISLAPPVSQRSHPVQESLWQRNIFQSCHNVNFWDGKIKNKNNNSHFENRNC